jgi:hypothetical protein
MQFYQCTLKSDIRKTKVFVKWARNTVCTFDFAPIFVFAYYSAHCLTPLMVPCTFEY